MEYEIWKECISVKGLMASNYGRIWLKPKPYFSVNGAVLTPKTKPTLGVRTRASKKARHEFYGYWFRSHGNVKVHRIVCDAWHGAAPSPRSVVIHIDENGLNNRPENLRWGTQKENLNMPKFIEYCKGRTGAMSPVTKHLAKQKLCQQTAETSAK